MNTNEWIGVDLDGTLASYSGWRGIDHIGEPIPAMVLRVKAWLKNGIQVKIFTARANQPEAVAPIQQWCKQHLGVILQVTATKDFNMIELWDDRAVAVYKNTGLPKHNVDSI